MLKCKAKVIGKLKINYRKSGNYCKNRNKIERKWRVSIKFRWRI